MIENKIINLLSCIDDNSDEIRLIDGLCFNTKVLNIKCFNNIYEDNSIVTEIILDKENVKKLRNSLNEWINECECNS